MKRCPTCQQEYHDGRLRFCRHDGSALFVTLAFEQAPTAILPRLTQSSSLASLLNPPLADELTHGLARIGHLRVVSRTSSFSFKGKDKTVCDIGKALKVNTVLEGSVRKIGNRLRITAQLIDVAHGYHIWSGRFDHEIENAFEVQDQISEAILTALETTAQSHAAVPDPHQTQSS